MVDHNARREIIEVLERLRGAFGTSAWELEISASEAEYINRRLEEARRAVNGLDGIALAAMDRAYAARKLVTV